MFDIIRKLVERFTEKDIELILLFLKSEYVYFILLVVIL
jgi:hypothetical protein